MFGTFVCFMSRNDAVDVSFRSDGFSPFSFGLLLLLLLLFLLGNNDATEIGPVVMGTTCYRYTVVKGYFCFNQSVGFDDYIRRSEIVFCVVTTVSTCVNIVILTRTRIYS